MFALEVEYLTGRAAASERDERDSAEWPPHPGRLFAALVAAHAERDAGDGAEREALLWLERQPPPAMNHSVASRRDVPTVYVPVNDDTGPDKVPKGGFSARLIADKIRVLPERRFRPPRSFPSVTPERPVVVFLWPEADPANVTRHRPALERLAANVTYLGHSSSLVRVAICDHPPEPNLRPADDDRANHLLRVPTPGRLDELLASYKAGRWPTSGLYCGYAEEGEDAPGDPRRSKLGQLIVFRLVKDEYVPLGAAAALTAAVRVALLALRSSPSELLSGHAGDGSPSTREEGHVAIVPLAFVDHEHADGDIKGFAVAVPDVADDGERDHVLRAIGRLSELKAGPLGAWPVERLTGERLASTRPLWSLRTGPYEGPALTWATVTPMVFDHFPRNREGRDVAAVVARACERIGLPAPVTVEVSPVSRLRGVPMSREFAIPPKVRSTPRPYWHVLIGFDAPVRGPIVLGTGRYLGLGLFRSFDGRGDRRRP